MEASVTLKAIAKIYRNRTILADLSFGIEKGTTFVILGECGSGKSTILKLLVGIIERDAGTAYIHGKDISTRWKETRTITGYLPQRNELDNELTVFENLTIYGQLHGLSARAAKRKAVEWSIRLGFKRMLRQSPETLSYGVRRKVSFARAIIHDPKVLLLDEPTKGLDPASKRTIWKVIDSMKGKKTILFITQDFPEAERYADRIAILNHGNIKMNGTLDRLIDTTHGLTRYHLMFQNAPGKGLLEELKEIPKVIRPSLNGNDLEFYSRERTQFFKVLEIALRYGLKDIDTSHCQLQDLFTGLIEGGLE